jgi:hypothetical protein
MTSDQRRGYEPNILTYKEQQRQCDLFIDNIDLLVRNAELILSYEEWFYSEPTTAFLSVPYIGMGGPIPLGVLLLL